ncbi:MAG: hypothetical protein IIA73_07595 [Proteobacteria bacterium]|nr:hypothetical protein [Pseudomonadota bacterium]
MMPMIRIDDELYEFLNNQGRTEDAFNDVLRRLLGFERRKKRYQVAPRDEETMRPTANLSASDTEPIERLMEKLFPPHNNPVHRRQLVKVVWAYLHSPRDWPTKDRQIYAASKVAQEERVTRETIQDGCTRRLGLNIEKFRGRLENLEAEYREISRPEK